MRDIIRIVIVTGACALALSCQSSTSSWYPTGSASIESSYELVGTSDKSCVATVKVTNSGSSKISSSTVSIKATTDARSYAKTATSSVVVLPGSSMYFDVTIGYASAAESLKSGGVEILGQYYQ